MLGNKMEAAKPRYSKYSLGRNPPETLILLKVLVVYIAKMTKKREWTRTTSGDMSMETNSNSTRVPSLSQTREAGACPTTTLAPTSGVVDLKPVGSGRGAPILSCPDAPGPLGPSAEGPFSSPLAFGQTQ